MFNDIREQINKLENKSKYQQEYIQDIYRLLKECGLADTHEAIPGTYNVWQDRKSIENYNNTLKSRLDTLMKYLGLEEEVIKTVPEHTIIKKVRNKS